MRIFLSLNPDNEVLEFLKKMQDEVKEKLGFAEAFKVKWEPYFKLHVTLFFLGEVPEEKLTAVTDSLSTIGSDGIGEISLETEEVGAFPNFKNPRVVVCKTNNKDGKIFTLYDRIAGELAKHGFEQDRKFKPHITLGRAKRNYSLDLNSLEPKKYRKQFTIGEFSVMKSVLSFKGSEYEELKRIKL